ncbi:MAG: carboxypeptidase-like regulatory domain-containing protein [Acidobacteriaceae bacterium]
MKAWVRVGVLAAMGALPMGAQQAGTVTGHVTCGDTQRPARFAGVMLLGVPKESAGMVTPPPAPGADGMKAAMKAMDAIDVVQTETGMDGNYTAVNVAPGDYYVFASVPGYVQPAAMVQAAIDAGADPAKQIPGIPMVHVGSDGGASADLTVQRGGAVSGHVMWDDGSPAAKAMVTVVSTKESAKKMPPQFGMLGIAGGLGGSGILSISDDLGQYRIAGLAPGEYVVKATMQLHTGFAMARGVMNLAGLGANKPLVVYAPAALHKADGKPVTVHAGDEITGEDVTVNLTGMHSVSGRVVSAEDGHGLNAGAVELKDASDKDVMRGAALDASGNFTVEFVPPGTYNLTVTGGADTEPSKKVPTGLIRFSMPDTVQSYEDGKQSVVVTDTDVTGVNVALQPSKTVKTTPSRYELLGH